MGQEAYSWVFFLTQANQIVSLSTSNEQTYEMAEKTTSY